jgi:PAS domain S-box-containing protein
MRIDELEARTDVPVIRADHHGFITAINDRFTEAYGWAAADLVGSPLTTIIPDIFHDAHHLGFSRFLASGVPTLLERALDLRIVTAAGTELVAEHFIVAERHDGDWVFAAAIRPLS